MHRSTASGSVLHRPRGVAATGVPQAIPNTYCRTRSWIELGLVYLGMTIDGALRRLSVSPNRSSHAFDTIAPPPQLLYRGDLHRSQ